MPSRKASLADESGGGGGGKEKETFGCPYPGCGQVCHINLAYAAAADPNNKTPVLQSYGVLEKTSTKT